VLPTNHVAVFDPKYNLRGSGLRLRSCAFQVIEAGCVNSATFLLDIWEHEDIFQVSNAGSLFTRVCYENQLPILEKMGRLGLEYQESLNQNSHNRQSSSGIAVVSRLAGRSEGTEIRAGRPTSGGNLRRKIRGVITRDRKVGDQ
jgi:hypothetical protein